MKRKAFTVVELMIALIILTLIITVLWKVYSATQKNANEVIENNVINDKLDRTFIKIIDDIREANYIGSETPKIYELNEIDSIKTEDPSNILIIDKINFIFEKNPADLDDGEKNYNITRITYYVLKDTDKEGNEIDKWVLMREAKFLDSNGNEIQGKQKEEEKIRGLDECCFYRINDPNVPRTGNIYIKIKIKRDDGSKYSSENVICIKERGAMP